VNSKEALHEVLLLGDPVQPNQGGRMMKFDPGQVFPTSASFVASHLFPTTFDLLCRMPARPQLLDTLEVDDYSCGEIWPVENSNN